MIDGLIPGLAEPQTRCRETGARWDVRVSVPAHETSLPGVLPEFHELLPRWDSAFAFLTINFLWGRKSCELWDRERGKGRQDPGLQTQVRKGTRKQNPRREKEEAAGGLRTRGLWPPPSPPTLLSGPQSPRRPLREAPGSGTAFPLS